MPCLPLCHYDWNTYKLEELHTPYQRRAVLAALSTATAVFLIVGAVVVIMATALCLTIPGVNVVSGIILPGFLPAVGAIALSLPFLLVTYWIRQSTHPIRKEMEHQMMEKMRTHHIEKVVQEIVSLREEIKELKKTKENKRLRKKKKGQIEKKIKQTFNSFFKEEIFTKGNTHYQAELLNFLKNRYEKTEKYHMKRLDPDCDSEDEDGIAEDDRKAVIALCKEMVSLLDLLKQRTLHPKAKAWTKKTDKK